MAKLQTVVQINGISVASYLIQYNVSRTYGDALTVATIDLSKLVSAAVTLTNGQTVQIWRDYTTINTGTRTQMIFDGYVETYTEGYPSPGKVEVVAKDKLWNLGRQTVTHLYLSTGAQAGVISNIFQDLVTTFGGMNADSSSVQSSGTTYILGQFICNNNFILERCQQLADTLQWQFYYDTPSNKVYFEPRGFTLNANAININANYVGSASGQTPGMPKWDIDTTEMINNVTVVGSYQTINTTQKFSGDGATTTFTLTYIPINTNVYLTATDPPPSSALQTGQVDGSPLVANYYVNAQNKTIRFAVAPGNGTNNIQVQYTYAIPTPVAMSNPASISLYGNYQKTVYLPDVTNTSDSENRGADILAKFSTPFTSTTMNVTGIDTFALKEGQRIQINDSYNNINGIYTINRLQLNYPQKWDTIDVGDKTWRTTEWQQDLSSRIQQLEQDALQNQNYLLNVVNLQDNTTIKRVSLTVQYRNIGHTFIVGHPVNGILGTANGVDGQQLKLGWNGDGSYTNWFTKNY